MKHCVQQNMYIQPERAKRRYYTKLNYKVFIIEKKNEPNKFEMFQTIISFINLKQHVFKLDQRQYI